VGGGQEGGDGFRLEWPDLLARSGADMPPGFFSVAPLERFMREAFAAKGLPNSFRECRRPLLIPAILLDQGERAVFGLEPLLDVPISQAIAASSSIPGFFEPFRIDGRDYVDGDVGYTGHADLAVEHGATRVVVLNPAVPLRIGSPDEPDVRSRGIYAIMEQAGHITSINILQMGLRELKLRRPDVEIHLVQPESTRSPLRGPSMGFEASRAALRYGFASVTEWLTRDGAAFAAAFRRCSGCLASAHARQGWGARSADHAESHAAWPLEPATRLLVLAFENLPRRHGPADRAPHPYLALPGAKFATHTARRTSISGPCTPHRSASASVDADA
jgi:hypothetical protein